MSLDTPRPYLDFPKILTTARANCRIASVSPWFILSALGSAAADILSPLAPIAGAGTILCVFCGVLCALVISRARSTDPGRFPLSFLGNGILVAGLLGVGFAGIWAWQHAAGSPSEGVLAENIPQIKAAVEAAASTSEGIRAATTATANGVHQLTDTVKREISADPRKELANMGLPWTAESFLKTVELGDRRNVLLFLAGGMSPTAKTDQSVVFYAIAHGAPDLEWTLARFKEYGLDLERPLEIGNSPAYPDPLWKTPIFVAAINHQPDVLQALARLGAKKEPLVLEFRKLIHEIDAKETEKSQMKDPDYCAKKGAGLPKDRLKKIAESYCVLDYESCLEIDHPEREFFHTARRWCIQSAEYPSFSNLDWSRSSPSNRDIYASALSALGESLQ